MTKSHLQVLVHVSWWYNFMSSCNIHSKVTLLMFTLSKIWKYKGHLPWYKMWNTLKHRNDYICTILINPILIINQFFHPENIALCLKLSLMNIALHLLTSFIQIILLCFCCFILFFRKAVHFWKYFLSV